jgi:hypothetical protein
MMFGLGMVLGLIIGIPIVAVMCLILGVASSKLVGGEIE